MQRITSDTGNRLDIMADMRTDENTGRVLEEAVGSPADIYIVVQDGCGYRCVAAG